MKKNKHYVILMVIVIVVDQLSKHYLGNTTTQVLNRGGIFGILPSSGWIIILVGFWLWIAARWLRIENTAQKLPLALIISAGLSNLLDRFIYQGVRDGIYYPWFHIYGNVADIIIAVSVVWLGYTELLQIKTDANGSK